MIYDMPYSGNDIIVIHKEDMKRILDAIPFDADLVVRLQRTGAIAQFEELRELVRDVKY